MAFEEKRLDEFLGSRDERAFRELYREHTPALYAFALRLSGGSRADAEELTQDAWVRAVERLSKFEKRSSFRTWLFGILVNCYRELKRYRTRAPLTLVEGFETHSRNERRTGSRSRAGDSLDVERALSRLADGYREVIVLHDLNGYTHREIAELLGIEEGTSKSQLSRAHARLRELLEGGSAGEPAARERGRR